MDRTKNSNQRTRNIVMSPKVQVKGVGPKTAKIVLVGEAPGIEEVMAKPPMPFVGMAGKELDKLLSRVGIPRKDVYITNVVKRQLPKNDFSAMYTDKAQKKPTQELLDYQELLQDELAELNPNVIVPLGRQPLLALTGNDGIGKWRGSILSDAKGRKIIPTYHPSAVNRDWTIRPTVLHDLQRVRSESWHPMINLPKRKFIIRPNIADVMDYLDKCIASGKLIGCDIEVQWYKYISCIAFSYDPLHAICIPFTYNKGTYWTPNAFKMVRDKIQEVFTKCPVVGQNFHFDWCWLKRDGFDIKNLYFDTWVAHHAAWPEMKKSLAFMASIYTREPYWKDESKDEDSKTSHKDVKDYDKYWTYNCKDAALTLELVEPLQREIETNNVQELFEFEMELIPIFVDQTLKGTRFDNDKRKELRKLAKAQMKELASQIDDVLPLTWKCSKCKGKGTVNKVKIKPCPDCKGKIRHINAGSPLQLKNLIYDHLKLPKQLKKATAKATLDEEALLKLQVKRPMPIFELLLKHRHVEQVHKLLGAKIGPDGRMHTSLSCGTHTGRLQSRETPFGHGTNLQNLPRKGGIRNLYLADEGKIFLAGDYEKAEAYAMGYEANDPAYIDALEHCWKCGGNGIGLYEAPDHPQPCSECKGTGRGDIHRKNAQVIFDKLDINDDERQIGKRACHGINYGMGPLTLCNYILKELGAEYAITMKEAKGFREAYFDTYQGLKRFQEFIENEIKTTRTIFNSYGRVRKFFGRPEGKTIRDAIAQSPQSTVADHTNRALLRIASHPELEFVTQKHDEVVTQVPIEDKIRLSKDMQALMYRPITAYYTGLVYNIPVEIETGLSWGELE